VKKALASILLGLFFFSQLQNSSKTGLCRKTAGMEPTIGEAKTGDLQGIRVYKFTHNRQQYLMAYRPPTDEEIKAEDHRIEVLYIDFYQVGPHENFYAALKKYLKS
jgi:hypothetical protein